MVLLCMYEQTTMMKLKYTESIYSEIVNRSLEKNEMLY